MSHFKHQYEDVFQMSKYWRISDVNNKMQLDTMPAIFVIHKTKTYIQD